MATPFLKGYSLIRSFEGIHIQPETQKNAHPACGISDVGAFLLQSSRFAGAAYHIMLTMWYLPTQ